MDKIITIVNTLGYYFRFFKIFLFRFNPLITKIKHKKQKSALLITDSLPPMSTGGTFRPLSWLKYSTKNKWRVDAITRENDDNNNEETSYLHDQIPQSSTIIRVPESNNSISWKLFPRIDGTLTRAIDYFYCIKQALEPQSYNVIIATGPSFHCFVAGYFLSIVYRVPLILDFRDEWTLCPFDFVEKGKTNSFFEKLCINHASIVFFTTNGHIKNYTNKYQKNSKKFHLLTNGWEPNDYHHTEQALLSQTKKEDNQIKLYHVGTLGSWVDPTFFLNTAQNLKCVNWSVDFVGKIGPSLFKKIKNDHNNLSINFVGPVPKSDVQRYQSQSDILLLISNPGLEDYIPGKLYDYIAAGKPILVFGVKSESSRIVEMIGAGHFVSNNDTDELASALINMAAQPELYLTNDRIKWIKTHTRESLANKMFETLEALLL